MSAENSGCEVVSEVRLFEGWQRTLSHRSEALQGTARFAVFEPPAAASGPCPTLLWLSGLTCNEDNFATKAGAQRLAAQLGLTLVMPDTSPRGDAVPDDSAAAYDFGLGAGFYLDATVAPWTTHYRMRSYLETELPALLARDLPVDLDRLAISGHSMGGHGALTLALRSPSRYASVSAFAPICAPADCPWGQKAFGGYLGPDIAAWRAYDACALIDDGARVDRLLVSQGSADDFLTSQLMPQRLQASCEAAGIPLDYRLHAGYDHSYFFIATFIDDHLRWHAERLGL
jgi:S-formylglutathione hydrolase